MFSSNFEDKNHLAMLAVPVILSMLIGFSGDVRAAESFAERTSESTLRETNSTENDSTSRSINEEADVELIADESQKRKQGLERAVVENDFAGFLAILIDTPFAEIMTEDAFQELVEQYKLYRDGYQLSTFLHLA